MSKYLGILENAENTYRQILHLTANENIVSPFVKRCYSSDLFYRYYLGKEPFDRMMADGKFATKAMSEVAELVTDAEAKAREMLGAGWVSFNLLSGAHAMMSVILAVTEPGDTVMTVALSEGGHHCTGNLLRRTGRKQVFAAYDYKNLTLDVEETAKRVHQTETKLLYLDTSVYLNPHPIAELRKALGKGVLISYDASHTLGLIMGGCFQDPLGEGADIISANTHKTFPGPHKAIIAVRDEEFGRRVGSVIRNSFYSTVHTGNMLALSAAIIEFYEFGSEYAKQIISNSNALAVGLQKRNCELRRANSKHYSENHQVHVFKEGHSTTYLVEMFLNNNISINTSGALGDRIFLRVGTQEVTYRGMKEKQMDTIAQFIADTFERRDVGDKVIDFNRSFTRVYNSR